MGMDSLTLDFAPLLPWWVLASLGGAAILAALLGLASGARGSMLRALAAAALILALANPSVIAEEREGLSDIALLVVDETPSQRIGERAAQTAEQEQAIRDRIEALGPGMELRTLRIVHDSVADGERGTELFSPLERALADIPRDRFAGAIVLSDGQVHDAPAEIAAPAAASGAPLHTVLTGREDEADRRIVVEQAPSFGLVDRPVTLRLRIEDGAEATGQARLSIRVDGGETRVETVPVNRATELEVMLEHRGATVIELEVEAGPSELTLDNNAAVVAVNGVQDRLRVLLVSGEPHPGERTWRNLLKSDPSVDLVHFTILRPPEKQDGTPIHELSLIAFPTRELFEVKLAEFDLIVFDRYRRRGVLPSSYLRNVVDYVENGGAVLMAVGPDFAGRFSLFESPLRDSLPAAPTGDIAELGFLPRVTDTGIRHPVTSALPGGPRAAADLGTDPRWGRWFRQVDTVVSGGEVLMDGAEGRPLLVLGRYGEGRVAQLLSDHVWLWDRGFEGGGPHNELMRRMAHWLMKEPELEENDLKARVVGDRLEIERRSLEQLEAPMATVEGPGGSNETLTLTDQGDGRYTATLPVTQPGLYRVSEGVLTAMAAAGSLNPRELTEIASTNRVLGPLAEATGGRLLRARDGAPDIRLVPGDRAMGGSEWLGLRRNEAYVVRGLTETPLLPGFAALALILGLAALAWRREAR